MTSNQARDPMHDIVAGERENLLNSGVVSGRDSFREGVVGSGIGAPEGHSDAVGHGGIGIRRMAAREFVGQLDESEELEGSQDVYDAAEAGLAVRKKAVGRKVKTGPDTSKNSNTASGTPTGASQEKPGSSKPRGPQGGNEAGAHEQAAQMRAKSNGAAGTSKTAAATAQSTVATEASAQAVGTQVAASSAQAASTAAAAEGSAGIAGAIASAGVPVAGVIMFILGALLVGQIVSALFGFWENEANKQAMEGLPPYITYEMVEAALDAQDKYGHPAGCTIAQIICESGMGDHMSQLATRDHNLFGMKWASSFASAPEVAGKASWVTGEEASDGSHYTITAQFTAFKGDAECIKFRSRVFLQASTYANNAKIQAAIREHDSDKMAEGLKEAGWATSSSYVENLKSIMDTYGLRRFDSMSLDDFEAGEESGDAIVATAYSQLGIPYVWGGSSPGVGLDCSGLTQYCYRQAGIRISHYTEDQKNELRQIPISQAKPGDILYRYGHVAIYIGGDKYIHEPHTGDVCRVASGTSYFTCALTARR
ncbi:C40 family peptidase [Slackia isoflavoniconvertens]|uniref:C40 family peptidase n=1 Tax=Slackia isoflavoniconvertens TaxID=572010 RepID=UPI003F9A0F58